MVDSINIEAWIDVEGFREDQVEDVTAFRGLVGWDDGLVARRGKLQVSFGKVGIAATLVERFQLGHESIVEIEKVGILLDERHSRHFLLNIIELANARVVDEGTREIIVRSVVLIKHRRRDVGDISSCIRLPTDINFVVLDTEQNLEVFEEFNKVLSSLDLTGRCRLSGRKPRTNGLVDPKKRKPCEL